ncbi:MAG: HAMP domain-containing protein [Myxococcales bacterium]|nr:HAMP domain-containing protein [Deltaproteobacteria bacterium]NNE19940.1 HAMP domain-containing protein [Myxococcales bacterium]
MRRSFLKLIVSSVLLCWAAGFVAMVLYARNQSWLDDRARRDGVFLAYELLDQAPAQSRAERLSELQQHFSVDFTLISLDEVERRVGRSVSPGEEVPQRVSPREEWYFLVFDDGQGALAAGPVHPAIPPGVLPVGLILAIVGLPLVAGLIALRVEKRLTKVERASQALAVGDLSVRVDDPPGSPDELAASFNVMAERVERLIRSRDELVQAVSHELGSPLSRLRFHMELLENQPDARREERLDAMTRELDALDELVAELLSYVQSDELELERHAFDPNRGLGDLAELARLEASEDRAVEVGLAVSGGASVFADPRLFQRAVENILRNAMKYARGNVLLELTQEDEHVRVAVHDDGPGIPEELREKVMIPFFRLEADRDRKTGGVGLGLAIVSRIVHRHGGRLAIDSSPLGGAMVATWWPRPETHR